MKKTGIEVFQNLTLTNNVGNLSSIRSSLVQHQTPDWFHAEDKEAELKHYSPTREDIIVFVYNGKMLPRAGLTLWQRENGYNVTNIVPADKGELSIKEYNSLLEEFVDQVVRPARMVAGFEVELTDPIRQLDSWISNDAAKALRSFSALANKSTTNSHPNDAERWETFVIKVHLENSQLNTDILIQWLIEIDGWDEESAFKLAVDYEKGLSLLETYDRVTRS